MTSASIPYAVSAIVGQPNCRLSSTSNSTPSPSGRPRSPTTASNPAQAHILEQALDAAGIRATVVGDYLDAGIGDIPGVQPEVWVRREDLARALEVLEEGRPAEGEIEKEIAEET